MLINDSLNERSRKIAAEKAKRLEEYRKWIEEQTAFAVTNIDDEFSPLNDERKLGKPMATKDFEAHIAKLNSKIAFMWWFNNNTHKTIGIKKPSGEIENTGVVYEAAIMPEFSIRERVTRRVPDPNYRHNRKDYDMNKYKWVPRTGLIDVPGYGQIEASLLYDKNRPGVGVGKWVMEDEHAETPGMLTFEEAWQETKRGWRTLLVMLVKMELLTVSQVERIFKHANTPEWAAHIGRSTPDRPLKYAGLN